MNKVTEQADSKPMQGIRYGYRFVKRTVDVVGSFVGLVCLSWFFLIIAILIKLQDGGPVFYTPTRLGLNGEEFSCHKFRTMLVGADNVEQWLSKAELEEFYDNCKVRNDPRILRHCHWLRKYSVDELPQLWDVLRGTMSLVGPRPCVAREAQTYSSSEQKKLFSVKPGMTGYWQVHGRSSMSFISEKARNMQLYYVDHCSIWLDIKILVRTVGVVLKGEDAV